MSLTISSPITALSCGSFLNIAATDGVTPYVYSLKEGGAGGSLLTLEDGSVTYASPSALTRPGNCIDEIIVTDAEENTASVQLIVGDYFTIFCDILAHELNLFGRVYMGNQKFNWPKDTGMFIVADVLTTRPTGNNVHYKSINNIFHEIKTISCMATMSVNIYSRGLEAMERKEEVLMALTSTYSRNQQTRNGIRLGTIPSGASMQNLSELDGDAMLYRFHFDVGLFYSKQKIKAVDYFDSFQVAEKINNA